MEFLCKEFEPSRDGSQSGYLRETVRLTCNRYAVFGVPSAYRDQCFVAPVEFAGFAEIYAYWDAHSATRLATGVTSPTAGDGKVRHG